MSDRWYYSHAGDKLGPFSGRQLHDLALSGQISRSDTVWKDGVEGGVPAEKVKHLFAPAGPEVSPTAVVQPPAAAPAPPEPEPPQPAAKAPAGAPGPRKLTAVGVRGAVIVGQDGTHAQYKKKCTACGHEDPARTRVLIRKGTMRVGFFCPKCRKRREVEIHGQEV